MKKLISAIIAFFIVSMALVGFVPSSVDAAGLPELKDIENHWAKESILQAVDKGYVSGYPDGTFKPDQAVSRSEFMRMLVGGLKIPHSQGGIPWYQPFVAALLEVNIHKEEDFKDGYNQPLTRLELVKLAVRATDSSYQSAGVKEDSNYMVYQAAEKGILAGVGAGELDLGGTTTRAQAVAIIERVLSVNRGEKLPVDRYALANAEVLWHRTNIFTVMPQYFNHPYNDTLFADVGIRSWKTDNLKIENKNFSAELLELIAVDMSDPKDPNRKLLPAASKIEVVPIDITVPEDAYILIAKYKINKNDKPKTYANIVNLSVRGFYQPQPIPMDKLVFPLRIRTNDKNYSWINSREAGKDGIGYSILAIPGSGYSYTNNRSINITLVVSQFPGSSLDDYLTKEILNSKFPEQ